jgi:trimethylamine--corrinoid protein Co-methyltransferase
MPLEILTPEEIERIHAGSLQVLEETGIEMREERALSILADAGCRVDMQKRRVRFPAGLVERLVRKAPGQFTWYARDPRHNIVLGDGSVHLGTSFGSSTILDLAGVRRPATYRDAEEAAILIDALPNVEEGSAMFMPDDRPKQVQWLWAYWATIKHSAKPIRGRVYGREQARTAIRMAEVLAGGRENLRQKPLLMANTNTVSPLMQHREQVEAIIEYASYGLPVIISPEVMAGATGPVTLAGALVQHNAEVLAGVSLVQAVNPGNPVVYGTVSSIMDMKIGAFAHGAIEHGMWSVAAAQLARFYDLPSRGNAGFTDSKTLDMQAGFESALTLLLAALGGTNYIFGAVSGVIDAGLTISPQKLVIDDEVGGNVRRVLGGANVNEATLAVELIKQVGPGGGYLGQRHTMDHLFAEQYMPVVADRRSYTAWQDAGGKDIAQRARERAGELLKKHQPQPLDRHVEAELSSIVADVQAKVLG